MSQTDLAALIILDGFGLRDEEMGNAVKQAKTPNFDRYWKQYPHNELTASGEAVGLPDGQMGNSEVGHLNIGAGRIVYQSLTRINRSIESGEFYRDETLLKGMRQVKAEGHALHLFGLLSDGGVHSHMKHLFALLKVAKSEGLKDVYVHLFLDGRDVGPKTALAYIEEAEEKMAALGVGRVATVSGRYYAMDRDKRWDRVKLAYDALVYGKGPGFDTAESAVLDAYERDLTDEFILPSVIMEGDGRPVGQVSNQDRVIFYNFRPDRAIQLSQAFTLPGFDGFDLGKKDLSDLHFMMFTDYSDTVSGDVIFESVDLVDTVGEVLSQAGRKQLRIAETEKYPHVTFFMSGGREETFPGEKRILIDSPKVATYDLQPEMSAYEIADALVNELHTDRPNAIILNFANPDMVGHSGDLEATIKAVEAVDECLGKVVDEIKKLGGRAIITADHGNADVMITEDGKPMTAHTTNPVPVIITDEKVELRSGGILADLAPTLLDLLDVEKPEAMTGSTLIK